MYRVSKATSFSYPGKNLSTLLIARHNGTFVKTCEPSLTYHYHLKSAEGLFTLDEFLGVLRNA